MKYEIAGDPIMSAACHCTQCQKVTGTAYSLNIGVPSDQFNITGDALTTYLDKGDSGEDLRRYFLQSVWLTSVYRSQLYTGVTIVTAGTLNDTAVFKPSVNIYCDSKMEWLKHRHKTVDFAQMPTK